MLPIRNKAQLIKYFEFIISSAEEGRDQTDSNENQPRILAGEEENDDGGDEEDQEEEVLQGDEEDEEDEEDEVVSDGNLDLHNLKESQSFYDDKIQRRAKICLKNEAAMEEVFVVCGGINRSILHALKNPASAFQDAVRRTEQLWTDDEFVQEVWKLLHTKSKRMNVPWEFATLSTPVIDDLKRQFNKTWLDVYKLADEGAFAISANDHATTLTYFLPLHFYFASLTSASSVYDEISSTQISTIAKKLSFLCPAAIWFLNDSTVGFLSQSPPMQPFSDSATTWTGEGRYLLHAIANQLRPKL